MKQNYRWYSNNCFVNFDWLCFSIVEISKFIAIQLWFFSGRETFYNVESQFRINVGYWLFVLVVVTAIQLIKHIAPNWNSSGALPTELRDWHGGNREQGGLKILYFVGCPRYNKKFSVKFSPDLKQNGTQGPENDSTAIPMVLGCELPFTILSQKNRRARLQATLCKLPRWQLAKTF